MTNQSYVDNPLDTRRPGIGMIYVYMFVEGVVFFILTLLIQVCTGIVAVSLVNQTTPFPSAGCIVSGSRD